MVIACAEGGTSIEDLAESNPEAIVQVPIDPIEGMTDANADTIVEGLKCSGPKEAAKDQVKALYSESTRSIRRSFACDFLGVTLTQRSLDRAVRRGGLHHG